MNITTTKIDSPPCTVLAIEGKVVGAGALDLEAALQQILAAGETRLVLDLAAAPMVTSSGLRVIIATAKRVRATPAGDLRLVCPSQQMLDVLELAGLLRVFKVYDSQQEAVESFRAIERQRDA
ncbi:MAG: STAS domain-containing protein [Caldilineales bacterium]